MNLSDKAFLQQMGFRLRERRLERGWTQADLAQKCSLHRTFVGSVERGERNLSLLNLRLLAKALRVRLADLLTDLD